jgi:hypothetical protein
MNSELKVYGLLYIEEKALPSINLKTKSFDSQITTFVLNAVTLAKSLETKNISFCLLTNRKDIIEGVLEFKNLQNCLNTKQLSFNIKVPFDIRFHTAHFKLDVIKYFSELSDDIYYCMCDLDMIAVNDFSEAFNELVKKRIPLYYDITDQVIPAYGYETVHQDMKKLSPSIFESRWSGGEFICGTSSFFKDLSTEIDHLYPNYLLNLKTLHHQGDEMITSVALELLRLKNEYYIAEAGQLGIVGRYWSNWILHPQKPFNWFEKCNFIHLPADKPFLANWALQDNFNQRMFIKQYKKRLRKQHLKKKIKEEIYRLKRINKTFTYTKLI